MHAVPCRSQHDWSRGQGTQHLARLIREELNPLINPIDGQATDSETRKLLRSLLVHSLLFTCDILFRERLETSNVAAC